MLDKWFEKILCRLMDEKRCDEYAQWNIRCDGYLHRKLTNSTNQREMYGISVVLLKCQSKRRHFTVARTPIQIQQMNGEPK